MPNDVLNATFLDGLNDWASPNALAVDETVLGAPGRLVLTGTSALYGQPLALAGSTKVGVSGHFRGDELRIYWLPDATGNTVVAASVVPMIREASGAARRGLPATFRSARGIMPPVGVGVTHYQVGVTSAGGAAVSLLKPYASSAGVLSCAWQPGPHSNLDLSGYSSWPTDLPAIMDEGLQADPIATRKGFSGDSGVEMTRRITRARRYRLTAQMALTLEEYDRLMQFFDETEGPFWFTRPGTHEVCLAQWLADGEPVLAGRLPGRRRVQIKLQLRVP